MNPVHFVKIQQSDGTEEMFIKASEIEKIIADFEYRKTLCDSEVKRTESSKITLHQLENMFSSGSSEALKFAITVLKELLPK